MPSRTTSLLLRPRLAGPLAATAAVLGVLVALGLDALWTPMLVAWAVAVVCLARAAVTRRGRAALIWGLGALPGTLLLAGLAVVSALA